MPVEAVYVEGYILASGGLFRNFPVLILRPRSALGILRAHNTPLCTVRVSIITITPNLSRHSGGKHTQTLGTAKFVGGENCINRRHPASSSFPSLSSLHPATQQLSQPPPSVFRSSNPPPLIPLIYPHLYCDSANQSISRSRPNWGGLS